MEGSWLDGPRCPRMLVTDGYAWPSIISLETNGTGNQIHEVAFKEDVKTSARTLQKYAKLKRRVPERCIELTYTGLFETRLDWAKAERTYPNGTARFIGFGHGNDAPAQLIVKAATDVTVISNCK